MLIGPAEEADKSASDLFIWLRPAAEQPIPGASIWLGCTRGPRARHLNKHLSLPTQPALKVADIQSELPLAKTIEFACTDDDDAESIRQYVTENISLPTSCVHPRPRLVSATCHSPQHARQATQLFKSIADNHVGMRVRFGIRFSQQQANHAWTAGTSGQNALIYARTAFLLLAQATAQPPEQLPKRQRTEHEKRHCSVDTKEDDSSPEVELQVSKDDQSEPEADRPGSEYGPLESHEDSVSGRERNDKHGSRGGGTGNRNGRASSSGTCRSTKGGSWSGSEADLPESEYGPLESDHEDRLSVRGLTRHHGSEHA